MAKVESLGISLPKIGRNNRMKAPKQSKKISRTPSPHVSTASKEDYNSVRINYKWTQERDFERVILENHSHLLHKRDEIYSLSKKNGITKRSKIISRLKPIGDVVKYCFYNIEPPNEYTAKTDRRHFREVAVLSVKFWKLNFPKKRVPITLIVASWFHDIERFIPETKCKYLAESVDKYRKRLIHPLTSAKVADVLLQGSPLSKKEKSRIWDLIRHHDKPIDANVVLEDGIELFSAPPKKILTELAVLMDADAFAFFKSTIYLFIIYKSKKNSKEWIWERVFTNLKRLRPHLRYQATKIILQLPPKIQAKMSMENANEYLNSILEKNKPTQAKEDTPEPDETIYDNNNKKNNNNNNNNNTKLSTTNIINNNNNNNNNNKKNSNPQLLRKKSNSKSRSRSRGRSRSRSQSKSRSRSKNDFNTYDESKDNEDSIDSKSMDSTDSSRYDNENIEEQNEVIEEDILVQIANVNMGSIDEFDPKSSSLKKLIDAELNPENNNNNSSTQQQKLSMDVVININQRYAQYAQYSNYSRRSRSFGSIGDIGDTQRKSMSDLNVDSIDFAENDNNNNINNINPSTGLQYSTSLPSNVLSIVQLNESMHNVTTTYNDLKLLQSATSGTEWTEESTDTMISSDDVNVDNNNNNGSISVASINSTTNSGNSANVDNVENNTTNNNKNES